MQGKRTSAVSNECNGVVWHRQRHLREKYKHIWLQHNLAGSSTTTRYPKVTFQTTNLRGIDSMGSNK